MSRQIDHTIMTALPHWKKPTLRGKYDGRLITPSWLTLRHWKKTTLMGKCDGRLITPSWLFYPTGKKQHSWVNVMEDWSHHHDWLYVTEKKQHSWVNVTEDWSHHHDCFTPLWKKQHSWVNVMEDWTHHHDCFTPLGKTILMGKCDGRLITPSWLTLRHWGKTTRMRATGKISLLLLTVLPSWNKVITYLLTYLHM